MLGFISALFMGGKAVSEVCKKEIPAEYHNNYRLENQDIQKVGCGQLSQAEYDRRLRSGYYSGKPVPNQTDLLNERMKNYVDRILAGESSSNIKF